MINVSPQSCGDVYTWVLLHLVTKFQILTPYSILLTEDEMAFDMLYCVAFEMMDAHWLAMRASYMEFNVTISPLLYI
jgi:hypothetical protein